MIHLDTDFLVHLLVPGSVEAARVEQLLAAGEKFSVISVAWMEFFAGPVDEEDIRDAVALVENRIVAFSRIEGETAARLFNLAGRKRALRRDSMVAATAVCAGAALATRDIGDFRHFEAHGLTLIRP